MPGSPAAFKSKIRLLISFAICNLALFDTCQKAEDKAGHLGAGSNHCLISPLSQTWRLCFVPSFDLPWPLIILNEKQHCEVQSPLYLSRVVLAEIVNV